MATRRFSLEFNTNGDNDIIDLSAMIGEHVGKMDGDGLVHLFAVGSTCAITTIEYEPGLIKHDLPRVLQQLVPDDARYEHEATWNDDNGHSHVRSALIGPSITVPFSSGRLLTGEYQQIVFFDFDTRPRRRKVIATIFT
jgi:secondary thiamine-phosphate synthase enzyme